MNLLKRELAPITADAWKQIDDEACRVLNIGLPHWHGSAAKLLAKTLSSWFPI
jgi:hypothetical protein